MPVRKKVSTLSKLRYFCEHNTPLLCQCHLFGMLFSQIQVVLKHIQFVPKQANSHFLSKFLEIQSLLNAQV